MPSRKTKKPASPPAAEWGMTETGSWQKRSGRSSDSKNEGGAGSGEQKCNAGIAGKKERGVSNMERKDIQKKYYEGHREQILARKKKYYEEHKEQWQDYYKRHAEEIKARQKAYYEANKEKANEYSRNYYQRHKDDILKKCKEYYKEHRGAILERRKGRCAKNGEGEGGGDA